MANPPDQLDKFHSAWQRLQRFSNTAVPNLSDRLDAVRTRATNGKGKAEKGY